MNRREFAVFLSAQAAASAWGLFPPAAQARSAARFGPGPGPGPSGRGAGFATVFGARVWPSEQYTRVTLETDRPARYGYYFSDRPQALVLDLLGARMDASMARLDGRGFPDNPFFGAVRIFPLGPDSVRFAFELKGPTNPKIFALPPAGPYRDRLVVDFFPAYTQSFDNPYDAINSRDAAERIAEDGQAAAGGAPDPREMQKALARLFNRKDGAGAGGNGARLKPLADPARQEAKAAAGAGTKAGAAAAASGRAARGMKRKGKPVVIVDPGHGGEDPGAIGPTGLREKDVTLAIGHLAKKKLEAKGYKVYMTRSTDIGVPVRTRARKFRGLGADMFVSVHADAFTKPEARGSSVFVLGKERARDVYAKYIADTQNYADKVLGVMGMSADNSKAVNAFILSVTQKTTLGQSVEAAKEIIARLGGVNSLHSADPVRASLAVLTSPDIPSVLVESAFISNPGEEKKLRGPTFRAQVADSISDGVDAYFKKRV